jgi:hypothetical protein
MLLTNLEEIFSKHKANEKLYRKNVKAYKEASPNFLYESPPHTLKYSTNSLNFEVKQVGLNGVVAKMESKTTIIPKEMKSGSIMEMA